MDRVRDRRDLLLFGLAVSLSWHMFWAFFVVPAIKVPVIKPTRSRSVFLGAILQPADLVISAGAPRSEGKRPPLTRDDFSGEAYFVKSSPPMLKPMARLKSTTPAQEKESEPPPRPSPRQESGDISFGLSDYADYFYQADFSDLKVIAAREDLAGFVSYKILLDRNGEVKEIKKIVGSGDPAFDLYLMLKLKKAIFRMSSQDTESWRNVRIRLKE